MGTTTLPDWATLWAREPSLRPQRNGTHVLACGLTEYSHFPFGWETLEGEVNAVDEVDPDTFADLCAMAAVRWLANTTGACRIYDHQPAKGTDTSYQDAVMIGEGKSRAEYMEASLDLALFHACETELNARDTGSKP